MRFGLSEALFFLSLSVTLSKEISLIRYKTG